MDVVAAPHQLVNNRAGFPELRRLNSMKGGDPLEGDFLAIDDLLDFSNEDIGGPIECSQLEYTAPQTTAFEGAAEALATATTHEATSSITVQASKLADEKAASVSSEAMRSVFSAGMEEEPGHLCVPCDDLADLEWLSNFVEESFSSGGDDEAACMIFGTSKIGVELEEQQKKTVIKTSIGTPQQQQHRSNKEQRASPVSSVLENSSSSSSNNNNNYNNGACNTVVGRASSTTAAAAAVAAVPSAGGRAARSKRPRSAVCFWNTRILSTDASTWLMDSNNRGKDYNTSASSTLTLSSEPSSDSETHFFNFGCSNYSKRGGAANPSFFSYKLGSSPKKLPKPSSATGATRKKKKQAEDEADGGVDQQANGRRCLHCASQKTPQWRAGPMGPKTLCNACGVRYKSGRLLPEYRPAASPTFVESIHSNSHRRVLEMRKKRFEDGDGDGDGDGDEADDRDLAPCPTEDREEHAPRVPQPPSHPSFPQIRNPTSSSAHHHLSTNAGVSCA